MTRQLQTGAGSAGEQAASPGNPHAGGIGARRGGIGARPTLRVWRVLALASTLAVVPLVTGLPQISSQAKPHPVKAERHEVGFVKATVASMRAPKGATGSAVAALGEPDPISSARAGAVTGVQDVTGDLAVVGVTWPKNAVTAGDQFQIRTLAGVTWSQWQTLDAEQGDGPDPAEAATAAATAAGGTSPYVVTGASKFEVRTLTSDPTAPTAAVVQVVDPGTSDADDIQAAPGGAEALAAKPTIYTRAQWGADESLRRADPVYGQVHLGFIHHTVSSNSYSASQVPSMIRGIYAYHVKGEGWNDIGYNFLIDRFGRTWEGRYGGMDRAVVGAQTLNYNSWSMGVSAIGNFDTAGVPQATTDAYKRIFAWKLSLSGLPATGTVYANDKYFQRVSGHRDGFSTACPGRYLYAKLAEIRAGASALIGALPRSTVRRDVDRNGASDALSYRPSSDGTSISSTVSVLSSASRQPVRNGVPIGTGWNILRNVVLSPDLNGDGRADIIAQDPAADRLRIYLGNGTGGIARVLYRGGGWNVMTRIIAARDRNGDGRNDILATNSAGDLVYYPGDGAGWVRSGRVIGRGWNAIGSITTTGDLNGDAFPDLLATRKSDGALLLYAGRSDGSVSSGVTWGSGWGSFSPVVGGSDLDGDQYPDVYARLGAGMSTYSTDGSGKIVRYIRWGSGWDAMTQLSTGADWNGDRVADLIAVRKAASGGALTLYAGTGLRDLQTRPAAFPTIAGADLVRLVGDVNKDGYTDAVARVRTSNTLVALRGLSGSRFGAPVVIGQGWNTFNLLQPAGDLDYDGVPDLIVRTSTGSLLLYPMTSSFGFKARRVIGGGWQGFLSVIGAGAFNSDANADVIALRSSDHALILYRGNGPNALQDAFVLKSGQNDLVQILGVGDYNGDTKADVLARASTGTVWIYPGDGNGALAGRQPMRGGEGVGYVLG